MPERNYANRTLYHGDNLPFLQGMNSGTVDLIATDPPFNKNRDFHSEPDRLGGNVGFPDRWRWDEDIHDEWLIAIQRNEPDVWQVIAAAKQVWGDDMGAFLCWLGVRLLEMRRVLADDGSLYLHIDHTAHAWVKCLLDAIFGRRNFQNEIVWCYSWPRNTRTRYGRLHDTLLFYTRGEQWKFNPDSIRQPYSISSEGRDDFAANASAFGSAVVLDERGKLPQDWIVIPPLRPNAKERTGFPTQKPLALYERIIKASSNPGDLVLDPFCGCATTPIAAERLGRQWVGMDIWDGAHEQVVERMIANRQLLADPDPQIHYTTSPPPALTTANRLP